MPDRLMTRLGHATVHRRLEFARIAALAGARWRNGTIVGAYIIISERGI
jgi:hypothetical protein